MASFLIQMNFSVLKKLFKTMNIIKNLNDHHSMFRIRMMTGKDFKMQKNDFDQQRASKAPIC